MAEYLRGRPEEREAQSSITTKKRESNSLKSPFHTGRNFLQFLGRSNLQEREDKTLALSSEGSSERLPIQGSLGPAFP